MTDAPALGTPALLALAAYLVAMIAIGFAARHFGRRDSGLDFFLGGKVTGVVMLFFTMQATQYSGNAFYGFTGMGYRSGLIWILAVPLVCLIVTVQLSFAPRLYVLSKRYGYLTPADYYADRFGGRALRFAVAGLTILSMIPYLMIQAVATGHAVVGLTAGALPFWSGVVFIAVVMYVYIVAGGWRAVVWTDAIQGVWLTVAIVAAATFAIAAAGGAEAVLTHLSTAAPEKFRAPASFESLTGSWLSLLVVSGIGFAMYPQAIQRIYAARTEAGLRTSFSLMLLVPFVIGTSTLAIGIAGVKLFPGLEGVESDALFSRLLGRMQMENASLVVFILCGLLAAIMSTASSVVLTLASIFTKDIYLPLAGGEADDARLARVGRAFTLLILATVVLLSLEQTTTLWRLTEIKVEFLMQLFPPLVLGLYWRRYSRAAALTGLSTGAAIVAILLLFGHERLGLLHAGLWGLLANFVAGVAVTYAGADDADERRRVGTRFFSVFERTA